MRLNDPEYLGQLGSGKTYTPGDMIQEEIKKENLLKAHMAKKRAVLIYDEGYLLMADRKDGGR